MTEVERYQRPSVDSWADAMPDVVKLSREIHQTEFVPKPLRGRPAAVVAAIMTGRDIGVPPLTALSHISVIEGRPTISAELMRARILTHGHELAYEETTVTRCRVKGRRAGSDTWTTIEFTADDAKRAGLTGKQNWRQYPQDMLIARATARLARMIFADVLAGAAYIPDELETGDGEVTAAESPRRRTARRAPIRPAHSEEATQAPAAEPAAQPETPAPPPLPGEEAEQQETAESTTAGPDSENEHDAESEGEGGEEAMITRDQSRKLHALFRDVTIDDRDERLRVSSLIVGRPLATSSELTRTEAATLIDTLEHVAHSDNPADNLATLLDNVAAQEASQQQEGGSDAST